MASLINVENLSLNVEEAREISKLIIEKSFERGILSEIHAVETGVKMKTQIVFAGNISDSLKKATGCTPNAGSGLSFTEKFWEPEIFDSRWEHCAADLSGLLKLFKQGQRINPDFYDRIDSEELGLIVALIDQMMMTALPSKIWFSDKVAETIADGGIYKNTTDIALYNVIDGLWKQIFAEISSGDANFVSISENAGASYVAQKLSADKGFDILTEMYNVADSRLLTQPDVQFLVTRSIADNYRATLRNKTLGGGFLEVTENGRPSLYFEGIPVKVMHGWDTDIKALFDNGTKLDKPNRALLTTPANIPVATLSTDDFETLTSFYDQYRKSNIIDVAFSLDAKFLENYMAVAAY